MNRVLAGGKDEYDLLKRRGDQGPRNTNLRGEIWELSEEIALEF